MDNYNINITNGYHKVMVTLQQWEYKGHLWYLMGGNCHGKTILDFDFESNDGECENDCNLRFDEERDYFTAILRTEDGKELEVKGYDEEFNDMIVSVEIIDYFEDIRDNEE